MINQRIKGSKILNKFDFLIRFLYCRVPLLSSGIHKLLFWKLYISDYEALDAKFEKIKQVFADSNISFKNKVILELGPGNSYLNAYNFLLNGAKKVILVDKFPRQLHSKRQRNYFKEELEFITNKYDKQSLVFLNSSGKLESKYIEFIDKDLADIENIVADIIYSVSVLEHVRNPGRLIRQASEILSANGCMYHHIDMRDHYNFARPFLFLRYSDYVWNTFLTKEGLSFTNRYRYTDFRKLFEYYGLAITWEEKRRFDLENTEVHNKFKGLTDLDVGIWDVVLEKN